MTLLNLQKRFLLMFADYREAVERAQRHDDEILQLRSANDELKSQLAQERSDNLARERTLNDRLMEMRFGRKAMNPSAEPPPVPSVATPEELEQRTDVRQWQKSQWSKLEQDVRKFYGQVNNPPPAN